MMTEIFEHAFTAWYIYISTILPWGLHTPLACCVFGEMIAWSSLQSTSSAVDIHCEICEYLHRFFISITAEVATAWKRIHCVVYISPLSFPRDFLRDFTGGFIHWLLASLSERWLMKQPFYQLQYWILRSATCWFYCSQILTVSFSRDFWPDRHRHQNNIYMSQQSSCRWRCLRQLPVGWAPKSLLSL